MAEHLGPGGGKHGLAVGAVKSNNWKGSKLNKTIIAGRRVLAVLTASLLLGLGATCEASATAAVTTKSAPTALAAGNDYYVVGTWYKSQASCASYAGIFMMQNPGQYDDFSCLKNSSGRWTLIVYYAAGGGGGAGSWSQHQ